MKASIQKLQEVIEGYIELLTGVINSPGWWFLLCFNHLHFNYTLSIIPSRLILLNTLSSCPFPINNVLGKKQIALSQVRVAKRTEGGLSDAYIYESFKLATLIHAE